MITETRMTIPEIIQSTGLPLAPRVHDVCTSLAKHRVCVLRADPGSGKSTLMPLALMSESAFSGGRILMLEPRRIAALASAHRMANLLGEEPGKRIAFSVRLEHRGCRDSRVEVVTEGMLTRRIQGGSGLDGVSVLVFDEFHERSVHADLALALALDLRRIRPDLAILLMSATMDTARIAAFLSETEGFTVPVVDCPGRPYPVKITHRPLPLRSRVGDEAAVVIAEEFASTGGDALAFFPGRREIDDAAAILKRMDNLGKVDIRTLHGSLPLAEQKRAIALGEAGRRKIILSTNVAETSLTVEGVDLVIDTGFVRLERYHQASGMDRLSLEKASLQSADQRAGRAGRLGPGRCVRLWSPDDPRPTNTEPEILRTELSSLVLDCALWGARKIADLPWLDPPGSFAWDSAVSLLSALGAVFLDGSSENQGSPVLSGVTERGKKMASLGVSPRLAAIVLDGETRRLPALACATAAALSDRDGSFLRGDADFRRRLALLRGDHSELSESAASGINPGTLEPWRRRTGEIAADLLSRLKRHGFDVPAASALFDWTASEEHLVGELLASGFPDLVGRRQASGAFRFPSGREARVDGPLSGEDWIVAAEADAGERSGIVRLCAPLSRDSAERALAPLLVLERHTDWFGLSPRLVLTRRAGRLVLGELREACPLSDLPAAMAALLATDSLSVLPWGSGSSSPSRLLERIRFWTASHSAQGGNSNSDSGIASGFEAPDAASWTDSALMAEAAEWLGPFLKAAPTSGSGAVIDEAGLRDALRHRLGWKGAAAIESLVPEHLKTPAGSNRAVDYSSGEPVVEVRIQEVFGLAETPRILGLPVVLRLLSPGSRPLQTTKDLGSFWRGTWTEIRKEMRGRYPRHYWPEDPLVAEPTTRAKPRQK